MHLSPLGAGISVVYKVCWVCQYITSTLEFTYQLERGNISSVYDTLLALFPTAAQIGILSYTESPVVSQYAVFIRLEKYQHIHVSCQGNMDHNVFMLKASDYDQISHVICVHGQTNAENKAHTVKYFFCSLLMAMDKNFVNNSLNIIKAINYSPGTGTFHHRILRENQTTTVSLETQCPKEKSPCQAAFQTQTTPGIFIRVDILQLLFAGHKVPTCLYGGLSLYNMWQETLALCNNYTDSPDIADKTDTPVTSYHFKPGSDLPMLPFTSSANEILIIFYHNDGELQDATVLVSLTQCRGIAITPCSTVRRCSLPWVPITQTRWCHMIKRPSRDATDVPCTSYQISRSYNPKFGDSLSLLFHIIGCEAIFYFGSIGQAHAPIEEDLHYTAVLHRSHHGGRRDSLEKFTFMSHFLSSSAHPDWWRGWSAETNDIRCDFNKSGVAELSRLASRASVETSDIQCFVFY